MGSKKCVGYWGTWANYRQGDGKFDYTNIDPKIYTHLIYTFFGLSVDGDIKLLDPWLDIDLGFIKKFIALKSINPTCKMLASVGGWNCPETTFSQMVATAKTRSAFAKNTLEFLKKYKFDGIDIDWEYPVQRDSAVHPEDKQNFVLLLREMKSLLSPQGLLLTIAVGATSSKGDVAYDIPGIVPNVDFINLMTYDLHGSWDNKTGINAPLYAGNSCNSALCVDSCVNYWLAKGCPKQMLIVGIATYGRTFTLQDPNKNGVNAPSSGAGQGGKLINQAGFLGYNEIVLNGWSRKWQDDQKVPYAFNGNQWVGYDDEESVALKAKYVRDKGLGGCMVWSIETDDFRKGSPLISTISKIMRQSQDSLQPQWQKFEEKKFETKFFNHETVTKVQSSVQAVAKGNFNIILSIMAFISFVILIAFFL